MRDWKRWGSWMINKFLYVCLFNNIFMFDNYKLIFMDENDL